MYKKIAIIALFAASMTACKNDKKPTAADGLTTAESIPPSIMDTTKAAENTAALAVSDKEVEAAKQKTEKETPSTSAATKKAAAKKAADEAAAKKKTAEAAAKKKAADAVKKDEKNKPKATPVTTQKNESKGDRVTKSPSAMIPAAGPDANVKKRNGKDDVLVRSEVAPLYPGGEAAMTKYLKKNLRYPTVSKENGVKGTVFVQFVVEKNGKVDDVVVAKGVDKLLDAEAKRVVAAMPKWAAGQQGGQAVAVQYVLPVKFELVE